MLKKILSACLAAWLCLALSGCSFAVLDPKSLMAPPKVNEDQQEIYRLLQGGRQEISFVYPRNGDYRSAILLQDFTGDGVEDVVGFTALEDNSGVEVQFLEKRDGAWQTLASFQNSALLVDRVCFGDLNGRGRQSVLIGWGSTSGTTGRTASVSAYLYENGSVEEYSLGFYGEMTLTDLDSNGVLEVFTVDKYLPAETEDEEPSPARARVYAWQNGAMEEVYSADADNSVSSYSQAVFGRLSGQLQGVVLDGAKGDGSITTQIFCLQEGGLANYPEGVNTEEYQNPYARPSFSAFLSRDISGDGSLAIPRVSLLPGLPEDTVPDSTSYLVEWSSFQPGGHGQLKARALMNSAEGYWFRLPYRLKGRISATNNTAHRTVTYWETNESEETGAKQLRSPLFTIRVFSRTDWEALGQNAGYNLLAAQGDIFYAMHVITRDAELRGQIESIAQSFQLLTE